MGKPPASEMCVYVWQHVWQVGSMCADVLKIRRDREAGGIIGRVHVCPQQSREAEGVMGTYDTQKV